MPRQKDWNYRVLLVHAFVGYFVLVHLYKNLRLLGISERNIIAFKNSLTFLNQILLYNNYQEMHLDDLKVKFIKLLVKDYRRCVLMYSIHYFRHITLDICALIEMYSVMLIKTE